MEVDRYLMHIGVSESCELLDRWQIYATQNKMAGKGVTKCVESDKGLRTRPSRNAYRLLPELGFWFFHYPRSGVRLAT